MKSSLIFTGYACNESCFFCSAEVDGRKHINKSTKIILGEIFNEYKSGSKHIEFIGGEVTIRNDINIILSFCKKLGFERISIETNGLKFEEFSFIEELLKNGLNYITLSIHGGTPEINDYHTGVRGSFDSKIQGIENLLLLSRKYDFIVSTNYVITSKNLHEIPLFLEKTQKYACIQKRIFAFVRPIKKYEPNYKNYLPEFREIKSTFEILDNYSNILIQYLPYCVLDEKYHSKFLDFFSKGFKVSVNKINIEDASSLEEAIQSQEYYFKECTDCRYHTRCRGVWKEYVDFFKMKTPPLLTDIK